MDKIIKINTAINSFVWGPVMLVLLMGTGIYLTIRTKGFTFRRLVYIFKNTLFKVFTDEEKGEGNITPFQAMATALAATVGTGNIAGVATAIATGGPGAVFWMWLSAFFGMATKFGEVILSIEYREKTEDGRYVGGPMYYIENGLNNKWLAKTFAVFAVLASFGIGNLVQSNSIAGSLNATFGIPNVISGILVAALIGFATFGGIKRIASITETLVPFMASFYILGSLAVLVVNFKAIPAAIGLIFKSAFSSEAVIGGLTGLSIRKAIQMGMARGVFSNEAGLGSAPIAYAAATTDHPARQGLWGIFEVFMDTLVICSMTALTILVSGVWDSGMTGVELTTAAFTKSLPGPGGIIVSIGILLFAFSTILSWAYYGERCTEYLFGRKAVNIYRAIFLPFAVIGAVGGLEILWDIADTLNGLMAIPNLIALLALSPVIIKLANEFFEMEDLNL